MVPVVDLRRRSARFADDFADRVRDVLASGTLLLGQETSALESELAAWAGTERTPSRSSSGAAALQLSLTAMGVGPGDDVVVPAFTAVPTASAVLATGARPVFADVDRDTAALTTDSVAQARTPATKAVVVVHLYGRPADLPAHGSADPRGRCAGARRDRRPLALRGRRVQLLPDEEPGGYRRRRCGGHERRGARRPPPSPPRARHDGAVRARGGVAELPDVGGRGVVAAVDPAEPRCGQRPPAGDRRAVTAPPHPACGGSSRTHATRSTSACSAPPTATRHEPSSQIEESARPSTIRCRSPSSRRTGTWPPCRAPRPRRGQARACRSPASRR